jgi:hypothetical protein
MDLWRWALAAVITSSAAVQFSGLLLLDSARQHTFPLGPSFEGLIRIVAGQVFSAAFVGSNMLGAIGPIPELTAIALAGTGLLVYIALRSGTEFRLFLGFSIALLAAALVNPKTGAQFGWTTGWQVLAAMPAAHYWFFPTLALVWGVLQLSFGPARSQHSQALGTLLLPLLLVGLLRDWRNPTYPDTHFDRYAEKMLAAQPGQTIVIPETPRGWTLTLIKK